MVEGRRPPLDLAAAESISAALYEIGRPEEGKAVKPTPSASVSSGLLEVRYDGGHMLCLYDPDTADVTGWDRALRQRLGARTAELVRYEPVAVDPHVLTDLMERVTRRDWHPDAPATALSASIDWRSAQVEVHLAAQEGDAVSQALRDLAGPSAHITYGGRFSRR